MYLKIGLFFVQRQVSLTQARIDMSELDEDGDGFLQPQVQKDTKSDFPLTFRDYATFPFVNFAGI